MFQRNQVFLMFQQNQETLEILLLLKFQQILKIPAFLLILMFLLIQKIQKILVFLLILMFRWTH
jgi:hypothetical protein